MKRSAAPRVLYLINTPTRVLNSTSNTVHRSQRFPCEITEIADKQQPKIAKYLHTMRDTMFHYSRHYNSTIKFITDCSDCGRNASVKSALF
jgi:hypothetical protein